MSESDIGKGARWRSEIEEKLNVAQAGIIVLTPDSLSSSWLLFEAGALSKKNERVYTYLVDLPELGDPLAQFQRTKSEKLDTLAMVKGINSQLPKPIEEERVSRAFEHNWSEFEKALTSVPLSDASPPAVPDPRETLREILSYLREQSKDIASLKDSVASIRYTTQLTGALGVPDLPSEYFQPHRPNFIAYASESISNPQREKSASNAMPPELESPES
jgi:hypothetical protein